MSDEIINFYKKAADTEEPQKPIEEQKETPAPVLPQPDEPFDRFLLELAEKLKTEKVITEKQQETFEEQIKQPVLEEDKNSDDPFKKFIGSFANIIKQDELVNREENIKEATINFINKLKEQPEEPFIIDDQPLVKTKKKYLPPKIKQKVDKLPKKEEPVVEEQTDEPVIEKPKDENKYVRELKTGDKSSKKVTEKIKGVSDIKSIVEKQVAEILSRYPNLGFTGGGGGTNVNILGNSVGGVGSSASGVIPGTGLTTISGSAIGGRGIASHGVNNTDTGVVIIKKAIGNDWGLGYTTALGPAPGVFGAQNSRTFVEELECGPRGQWPTAGVIFFTPNPKATSQFETDTFENYSLIQSNSADNLLPLVSSVRQGIVYNLGTETGTCIIPPASSVGFGVPIDNTIGAAVLTPTNVWNITSQEIIDSQSLGGRLKNTLTANAAEKIVNSFNFS